MSYNSASHYKLILAVSLIAIVLIGGFIVWNHDQRTQTAIQTEVIAPAPAISVARPGPEAAPAQLPEEITNSEASSSSVSARPEPPKSPAVILSSLNESDSFIAQQLASLTQSQWLSLIVPEEQLRKLVRAIIGISDDKLVNQYRPVMSPLPPLGIEQNGSMQSPLYTLTEKNYDRYDAHMKLLDAIPASALARVYQTVEPLFEEAYAEQGLGGTFKPVLIKAIDKLLIKPEVNGSLKLVRPAVMYRFADPALESLPDTQKLLIRMGPKHSHNVRTYLTELKALL